jgi:hypothetical protein
MVDAVVQGEEKQRDSERFFLFFFSAFVLCFVVLLIFSAAFTFPSPRRSNLQPTT